MRRQLNSILAGMFASDLVRMTLWSKAPPVLKEVFDFRTIWTRQAASGRHSLRYRVFMGLGAAFAYRKTLMILALGLPSIVGPILATQGPTFRTAQAKEHYDRAIAFSEKSDWNGAVLELNRALRHEPTNLQILIELGIAYGELKDWEQATRLHKKAVQLAPSSARAHYNLGVTLDRSRPGKGLGSDEYRKVLQLNPKDVNALVNLAVNMGDQQSAEARKLLEKALQLDPKNPEAHFNLGLLHRNARESKRAVASFERAIELNPEALEPRRQLVSILVLEESWDEASKQCERILNREPDDPDIRYTYGQTLIRKGLTEEGRKELQRSQADRQKRQLQEELDRLTNQGVTSLRKGAIADSLGSFNEALAKDATHAPAYMYMGLALASKGDLPRAIEALSKAVQLDPTNARAHHNLGTVLLQTDKADAALREFETALKLDPYFPETHNNVGLVLSGNQQVDKAVEHFEKAAELNPRYVEAIFNMGLALRSSNRLDEALQAFQRAASLAPRNPQVQLAVGMTLKDKGDLKGSQEALARAKALQKAQPSPPGTSQ